MRTEERKLDSLYLPLEIFKEKQVLLCTWNVVYASPLPHLIANNRRATSSASALAFCLGLPWLAGSGPPGFSHKVSWWFAPDRCLGQGGRPHM